MEMSKNFTLAEFVKSETARKLGIDNTPPTEVIAHLGELVFSLLQPIRDAWGAPIIVTSGYRCPALNKAVGGVETSSHLTGYAADIRPEKAKDLPHLKILIQAVVLAQKIPFDQILFERHGGAEWIHISVRRNNGEQRGQLFTIDK